MYKFLIILFLIPLSLFALEHSDDPEEAKDDGPLFSGTLLSFSEHGYDLGKVSIQAYFLAIRQNGVFDSSSRFQRTENLHQYPLLWTVQAGIFPNVDAQINIGNVYSHSPQGSSFTITDTTFIMGFQILSEEQGWDAFDLRILLGVQFPTGKFNNLNLDLRGVDISGSGSYESFAAMAIGKLFLEKSKHPINLNYNLLYNFLAPTRVDGVSVYGGGPGTKGRVKPGDLFITNFAFQLSLTRHWVFDMDFNYNHARPSIFYPRIGHVGPFPHLPSSDLFSYTAGIQYNRSEKFGMAAGTWRPIYGRNTPSFVTYYFNAFYLF